MYQNRKLEECKLFRLQVSQRWTLYFWKYGPKSRNKNSGTKEIWSKSNWVKSWLHQGVLRMKQRCGDQNLIRKPRSFAKHVMGDKLGVENLPHDWGASRILARNCHSFHESIAFWRLTITVDTWKLVFWQETQLKWPSGAYRRCLQSMDFPILWQVILVPIFVAESFETFLMDNGIKHRKTTPLWPRPMVRLKAKKRSLLKRMLKAQVEGKN